MSSDERKRSADGAPGNSNPKKQRGNDAYEPSDEPPYQMDSSERIEKLEKQVEDLEKQMSGVQEVQLSQQKTIHGLEKVTRGHNLRIFGLDKNHLYTHKHIENDDWNDVFQYLCKQGLGISGDLVAKIMEHVDICHELVTGGFIVSFNRRSDRTYILSKKRTLGPFAPCISLGAKYKYVSIQVDLPAQEQAEKVLRNKLCQAYKAAGLKVKYVGWNKMAIGDGIAQLYSSFPNDPSDFKKINAELARKASMNIR